MPNEITNEVVRVSLPDWIKARQAELGKILISVVAKVFEENIAKRDTMNALIAKHSKRRLHFLLVLAIRRASPHIDFVKRHANRRRLSLQKFAAHAVHANAVVVIGHR